MPLAGGLQHDVPEAVHSRDRSRDLLEQAFDGGYFCVPMRNLIVLFLVDSKYIKKLCLLDQLIANPAATGIHATGYQMVPLCRSVCEEEKS